MGAYVLRRILIAIPVLVGITLIGYVALSLAPGDPITARLDANALAELLRQGPDALEARRREFGLDKPVPVQYLVWLGGVLRGDLGYSVVTHRLIVDELAPRIGPTLLLMGSAVTIALLVGIPAGIISAVRQYSRTDYSVTAFSMIMISTPTFVIGLIGIYIFAVYLGVLPAGGMATLGAPFSIGDRLSHLILPATVLGLANAAPLMRYTRASMLEVLNSDYITTARSKGLASRTVILRHAMRNALIPVITMVGLLLPELVGGAVITEQVFSWPGMGQLAVRAAADRDPALMMGVILVVATAVLVSNLLTDIAYGAADPRIRLAK